MIKLLKQILNNLLKIGASESDSESTLLKKSSITIVPVMMGPVGLVWSLIFFALDQNLSATIPLFYTIASIFSLWHFHKTKNIQTIQKIQMVLVLIVPFVLMWSLGGFALGSYVMIWAFFAPIAALIHDKSSKSLFWLYSFIALVVFSTVIDQWLIDNNPNTLSQEAIELFFFLNIVVALSGIYFLIKHFINENEKNADLKLQLKNDALVTNTAQLFDNLSYLESYKNSIDKNLIVTRTDLDGNITFANENFYKISGFTEDEVIGKKHNIIRHPDNLDSMFEKLWKTILSKKTWHGRIKNMKKDGSTYWIDSTIAPIFDKDENIVEFIGIRHDITKLLQQQEELTKMLYTDSLTGLKNRNALPKELEQRDELSLIIINIDSFSQINDVYGAHFGNKVLIEFANFLKNSAGKNSDCEVFRFNGDEFVILSEETNPINIANNLTQLLREINANPLLIEEQEIALRVTIGVSLEEKNSLLSTANMAFKIAKRESKSIVIYTKELSLNNEYENNLYWIQEIKDAIKEDRITMFFQPIVNNKDNSINKYETLIRLIDRDGNVITPFHFLEIAKKAKLYKKLTKIVIKKSFEAFKENNYEFSINITIDDILDEKINRYIVETLKEYEISKRVTFEIVESESIDDFEKIESFITEVKSFGCKISIDDFGTGYSNFEHLMRLQADYIKIDGSIIKEITTNKRSELITSVIVAFAKEMNIETIGEFVESKEINDKLIELGVNKSQGYYFDKPQATLAQN